MQVSHFFVGLIIEQGLYLSRAYRNMQFYCQTVRSGFFINNETNLQKQQWCLWHLLPHQEFLPEWQLLLNSTHFSRHPMPLQLAFPFSCNCMGLYLSRAYRKPFFVACIKIGQEGLYSGWAYTRENTVHILY